MELIINHRFIKIDQKLQIQNFIIISNKIVIKIKKYFRMNTLFVRIRIFL